MTKVSEEDVGRWADEAVSMAFDGMTPVEMDGFDKWVGRIRKWSHSDGLTVLVKFGPEMTFAAQSRILIRVEDDLHTGDWTMLESDALACDGNPVQVLIDRCIAEVGSSPLALFKAAIDAAMRERAEVQP